MPSRAHCSLVSLTSSAFTSSSARLAPLPAKCCDSERPMPRPAPVTTMVLPLTFTGLLLLRFSAPRHSSAATFSRFGFAGLVARPRAAGRVERGEHRGLHLGPHLHVLTGHLGERRHRRLKRFSHLCLHHVLLLQQAADALLQVLRQQLLDRVAVETNDGLE